MEIEDYPKAKLINEAFDPKKVVIIDERDIVKLKGKGRISVNPNVLEYRSNGELAGRALFLNELFDWQIVRDSEDALCLIATAKKP